MSVRTLVVMSVALVLLSACSFRRRLSSPSPATLPVDQRVEVWRGGKRQVLHHVSFDSVAVTGIRAGWQPRCDTCRVSIPRADADSIVLVNSEGNWMLLGTVGLLAVWIANHCWPSVACFD